MNYRYFNLRQSCFVVFLLVASVFSFRASAQIVGINNICVAASTLFTDATPGGVWASNNARATVSSTGVVTGISPGLDTITYNVSGVITIKPILIHPIPGPISGPTSLCFSATLTLTDPTSGGNWSSSNPGIPVDPSGVVTGSSAGSTIISYTLPATGCFVTSPVTVNTAPNLFIGCDNVGVGDSLSFYGIGPSDVLTTDPSIATFDPVSKKIIGVAPGITLVALNNPLTGCAAVQRSVTVTSVPMISPVAGNNVLCAGDTLTITDSVTGGIWSSSDASIVSVSPTGLATAVSGGLAIITYSVSGFTCNEPFAVNSLPAPISGTSAVCTNDTIILNSATGSFRYGTAIDYTGWDYSNPFFIYSSGAGTGTFTSSDSTVAGVAVNLFPGTGYVQGIAAGIATITYADNYTNCKVSYAITVNPLPSSITGFNYFHCPAGGTTLYSDSTSGGTWTSSNPAVAAINPSTGVLTASSIGTITISYTLPTGCFVTRIASDVLPSLAVSGGNPVCPGGHDTLTWYPGCTWSSSTPSIVSVGATTGYLTGLSSGIGIVNASMGTGCNIARVVTINAVPAAISGSAVVCAGDIVTLATTGTGYWNSLAPAIATVDSSSGTVSGVSPGVSSIVFTNNLGCTASKNVTVDLAPIASPLAGPDMVCQGSVITLTDPSPGGVFSSSLPGIMTVSTSGDVTGVAAGEATISYSVSTLCASAIVMQTVTVNPLPAAGSITGASALCPGTTFTLSDPTVGGVWASSNANATVSSGLVTGITAGLDTIFYSVTNICGTAVASKTITVNPLPAVGPITGPSTVCVASAITLSDSIAGGAWSSSSFHATVAGGVTSGMYAGTATITYTTTTPCGSLFATKVITVNPLPFAGTVGGSSQVCIGSAITLTDTATGGTWSATNGHATVAGGIVAGISAGIDTIGYSVSNSCGSATGTEYITINPLPVPLGVTGGGSFCAGGAGVSIGMGSSEPWVSYLLYRDTVFTGDTVIGTGGALDFGLFNTTGSYHIKAVNTTTGCVNNMTGSDTVYIAPPVIPTVTITAHPGSHIGVGLYDTLTATISGGGSSPTYQWYVNGSSVYGATSATYIRNILFTGDSISCQVTSSAQCGGTNTGHIIITTVVSGVKNIGANEELLVFPNPNKGAFTFNYSSNTDEDLQIVISSVTGEKVKELSTTTNKQTNIQLDAPPGMYFLTVITSTGKNVVKVSVE